MTKIFSCEKIRNKISLAFDHRLMNRTIIQNPVELKFS